MSKTKIEKPFLPVINEENQFDEGSPPNGSWRFKKDPFLSKITAFDLEQQLFVKAFSPLLSRYANLCHLALQELSQLKLPVPVLAPTVDENGYHYFTLGSKPQKVRAGYIYSKEQIEQIVAIIEKYGLAAAFGSETGFWSSADTVIIDGKKYLIDPIDDSFMGEFME